MRHLQQESIQAALALVLGPETDYQLRVRAARRLARRNGAILPLLLTTLSNYPEITSPAWPWWPPQYEHISRLLLHICQHEHLQLAELLHHPVVEQPAGPVLWTSLMEAAGLIPLEDHEELLCKGLETNWTSVRYAATMALANRANKVRLHPITVATLCTHLGEHEEFPVRLTTSYALLNDGELIGLDAIIELLAPHMPPEVRKAASFILAMALPRRLSIVQREKLIAQLLEIMNESNTEIVQHAAHALSKIAFPSTLPVLYDILETSNTSQQIIILTVLEEVAQRRSMRQALRQQALPTRLLPLLTSPCQELRRQACYTMATCGGGYVAAALGTIVSNKEHPAYIEAIESLRLLHGAYRAPLRDSIVRWLLLALHRSKEEVHLISALDSLTYLLWQAQTNRRKKAWHEISTAIIQNGVILTLLHHNSARVRQHTIELLTVIEDQLTNVPKIHTTLLHLLHMDRDSGVRACIAYALGQTCSRQSIPDLLQALLDRDEHVALTALMALEQISTPDDTIVVYVCTELAQIQHTPNDNTLHKLSHHARLLLKKWQKIDQKEMRKKLHSCN